MRNILSNIILQLNAIGEIGENIKQHAVCIYMCNLNSKAW